MKKLILIWAIGMISCQTMSQEKAKKALFVILDGIPADVLETVPTPHMDEVIAAGAYTRAIMGGEKDGYSETPTISAVGYNTLLTGTWANKHNVWGNSIKNPNYNYWTVFRLFKQTFPEKKAAIFSTWLDNRTKLAGANLPETGNFAFDYYFDGLELDTLNFPHDDNREYIHRIDEEVSKEAARYIRSKAPDLSWMYLEYSDDMGHKYGNSPQMVEGIIKADKQIGRVWESIKFREAHYHEDWLIIITTDHGRKDDGFGHGGQSDRERTIWIATNAGNTNDYFKEVPGMVDILPSLAYHLDLEIPKKLAMELDGVSFLGPVNATGLKAEWQHGEIKMTWKSRSKGQKGRVWVATTNHFQEGGLDHYWSMGEVELEDENASFSLKGVQSDFYKVVLETPYGYLNYWIQGEREKLTEK